MFRLFQNPPCNLKHTILVHSAKSVKFLLCSMLHKLVRNTNLMHSHRKTVIIEKIKHSRAKSAAHHTIFHRDNLLPTDLLEILVKRRTLTVCN